MGTRTNHLERSMAKRLLREKMTGVNAVSGSEAGTGRCFGHRVIAAHARRSLRLLVTTLRLLTAIAAAARAGVSRIPNAG